MVIEIVIVGWLVGAVSVTVALLSRDPGILGALGLFVTTSLVGSLAACMSLTLRSRSPEHGPCSAAGRAPADRPLSAARGAQGPEVGGGPVVAVHGFSMAARVPARMPKPGFSALRTPPPAFRERQ